MKKKMKIMKYKFEWILGCVNIRFTLVVIKKFKWYKWKVKTFELYEKTTLLNHVAKFGILLFIFYAYYFNPSVLIWLVDDVSLIDEVCLFYLPS